MARSRDWGEAREKVEREDTRCRVCGRPGAQAAHVTARSLGGGMTADDIVPLCGPTTDPESCHARFDGHRMDLLPFLTRAEEIRAVELLGLERARKRLAPSDYRLRIERARRQPEQAAA